MRVNWTVLNPLHWKRTFLLWVLAGIVAVWIGFLDTYSLWARYTLSRERADLIRRTEELTRRSDELSRKITELQRDPALLERIAREEYGMRRPGETVYRIRKK
jgi:cell division protein FtsB